VGERSPVRADGGPPALFGTGTFLERARCFCGRRRNKRGWVAGQVVGPSGVPPPNKWFWGGPRFVGRRSPTGGKTLGGWAPWARTARGSESRVRLSPPPPTPSTCRVVPSPPSFPFPFPGGPFPPYLLYFRGSSPCFGWPVGNTANERTAVLNPRTRPRDDRGTAFYPPGSRHPRPPGETSPASVGSRPAVLGKPPPPLTQSPLGSLQNFLPPSGGRSSSFVAFF